MPKFVTTLSLLALVATTTQAFTTYAPSVALHTGRTTFNNNLASSFPSALAQSSESFDIDEYVDPSPLEEFAGGVTDVMILILRLATCSLMIHHGFDKVQNVDGFSANVVAKFFGFLPGPASFWTLSAAGTQIVGSGLLALGIFSRPVAFSMLCTMAVAVIFHLENTGPEGFPLAVVSQHSYNFELAAMYVFVLGYFSASGAGAFSLDNLLLGGELNFYGKLLGGEGEEEE